MQSVLRALFYLSLITSPLLAHAATEVAGVNIDASCNTGDQSLKLNGAGVRSKFFFKIYVGVLCVEQKSHGAVTILAAPGAMRMQMNILYSKVSAEKLSDGWTEGFRANLDDAGFERIKARLKQFNALFPTLHEGDVVDMDYRPGRGTELTINGKSLGTIKGKDFFTALLRVWIGRHPADTSLKKGLLGK